MTNREKYDFDCFTLAKYPGFIELALENGFKFKSFLGDYSTIATRNIQPFFCENEKSILWRHDVEFSPYTALEMAKIEADLKVKSTYFFQIHAETYNLFERAISDIALQIRDFGHEVGLHYDSHYYNVTDKRKLEDTIKADAAYFEAALGVKPEVFSFHCTDHFIKSCEDDQYGGLINVYSKFFKTRFAYCADSTGYWRYERLEDRLNDASINWLQVLIHDAMWSHEVMSPRKRVFAAIDERAQRTKDWYDGVLTMFGAKNIDD